MTHEERLAELQEEISKMDYNSRYNIENMKKHFNLATSAREHLGIFAAEVFFLNMAIEMKNK